MSNVSVVYNKYNPISRWAIRPALRLVNAHMHPIRGGVAAAIASGLAHYGLVLLLYWCWHGDGVVAALARLPLPGHICFGINMLTNFIFGVGRYMGGKYGDRKSESTRDLQ